MRIVDTHAHLYLEDFEKDLDDVVARARAIGVEKILLPNIDETTVSDLKQTVDRYPSFFIPMMGLHPTNVREDWEQQLEIIYDELSRPGYIAIGEIGIDLYWDKSSKERQVAAFERQLAWSIEKKLPVAIHSREAIPEVIESIKKNRRKRPFRSLPQFWRKHRRAERDPGTWEFLHRDKRSGHLQKIGIDGNTGKLCVGEHHPRNRLPLSCTGSLQRQT